MDKWYVEPEELIKKSIPYNEIERGLGFIYFLVEENEIVYVGQSIHKHTRIYEHKKDKVFSRVCWIEVEVKELDVVETYYILSLQPRYNTSLGKKLLAEEVSKKYNISMPSSLRNKKSHPTSPKAILKHARQNRIKNTIAKRWIRLFGSDFREWLGFVGWTRRTFYPSKRAELDSDVVDEFVERTKMDSRYPKPKTDHEKARELCMTAEPMS